MATREQLVERVQKTQAGFGDIRKAANEVIATNTTSGCIVLAKSLYESEVHQARMLATFIFGHMAAASSECFQFLYGVVSQDRDWRVQEILAQAFDLYCAATGYEKALPMIEAWLGDANPDVRRAASEGLRIWTAKPYFRDHPEIAIRLLSQLKGDGSEYVRKSIGNALRDISRKHPDLVRAEVQGWDVTDKKIAQTYKLASKFL
jgi:3-methyladenine DNA glycosylase AlkD